MKTLDNYIIKYPLLSAREKKEEFDNATGSFMPINNEIGVDLLSDLIYTAWKQGRYLNIYFNNKGCFPGCAVGYEMVDYEHWFSKDYFDRDYKLIEAYEDVANGYIS